MSPARSARTPCGARGLAVGWVGSRPATGRHRPGAPSTCAVPSGYASWPTPNQLTGPLEADSSRYIGPGSTGSSKSSRPCAWAYRSPVRPVSVVLASTAPPGPSRRRVIVQRAFCSGGMASSTATAVIGLDETKLCPRTCPARSVGSNSCGRQDAYRPRHDDAGADPLRGPLVLGQEGRLEPRGVAEWSRLVRARPRPEPPSGSGYASAAPARRTARPTGPTT